MNFKSAKESYGKKNFGNVSKRNCIRLNSKNHKQQQPSTKMASIKVSGWNEIMQSCRLAGVTLFHLQKKQLVDTLAHLLESLPLCCHHMVGILLNNASQSMPNLYKKTTKRPRPSIMSHCAAQLLYWSYTRLVPVLFCIRQSQSCFASNSPLFVGGPPSIQQPTPASQNTLRGQYTSPMIKIKFSNTINGGSSPPIHSKCFYTAHQSAANPSMRLIPSTRLFRTSVTAFVSKGRRDKLKKTWGLWLLLLKA